MDPELKVQLVACEPEVRTPTAVQVDARGRVWVLENNTHFRPKEYAAPSLDRVLVLDEFGEDGRARKVTEFAAGFRDGMGLLVLGPGEVVVATRSEVLRIRDRDGDGKGEARESLLTLKTEGAYPHNGMSGLSRDAEGHLYVGLGENFGKPWELRGSDGSTLYGADHGGVFRFERDGSGLVWWALGFWNPFGSTVTQAGELFVLDNDPGGGSLCRLLHVVPGGDYGFRYRYGRTTRHPFVSWLGELPGTLPPVCLSGEAPTGLLQFNSSGLGKANEGQLLGATWSDHGVQRFPLVRRGVSYGSKPEWLLQGGADFRPSGLAEAPDGSLVISDWGDGAYEVHGKGRVWRVRGSRREASRVAVTTQPVDANASARYERLIAGGAPLQQAVDALADGDPFIVAAAIRLLSRERSEELLSRLEKAGEAKVRAGLLLALRRGGSDVGLGPIGAALRDPDPMVRCVALQWASEAGKPAVVQVLDRALEGEPTREVFQAYLAGVEMLTAGKPDPKASVQKSVAMALDGARPAGLRALALRLIAPSDAALSAEALHALIGEKTPAVQREAVRIAAARPGEGPQADLRALALDGSLDAGVRAEAVAGLASSSTDPATQKVLRAIVGDGDSSVRREAVRALGEPREGFVTASGAGADEVFFKKGDAAAGRRLFYSPKGPGCSSCHAVDGRGGAVGPDLTQVGRLGPQKLLEAIRLPSAEIAPAYGTWRLRKKDGIELLGIDQFEDNKSHMVLMDATGKRTRVAFAELAEREPVPVSLMPPGLDATLSVEELRDLLAFLGDAR